MFREFKRYIHCCTLVQTKNNDRAKPYMGRIENSVHHHKAVDTKTVYPQFQVLKLHWEGSLINGATPSCFKVFNLILLIFFKTIYYSTNEELSSKILFWEYCRWVGEIIIVVQYFVTKRFLPWGQSKGILRIGTQFSLLFKPSPGDWRKTKHQSVVLRVFHAR